MSVEAMLKSLPFFHQLADEQLGQLANIGRTESWQADRILFSEGDEAGSLYVILAGKVKIFKRDHEGEEIQLATLGKGDFFGEMALFEGVPRSASVSTMEPCEFFSLGRDDFFTLLAHSPRLIPEVLAGISSKIRAVNEKFFREVLEKQTLRLEMERERHRSLAQMVAGVAHEINTPLGIVNTAASILTESLTPDRVAALAKDEEARALFEDVLEAARLIQGNLARATKLVQTFKNLSISQITDAKETRDLPALVDEIVALYRPQARLAHLQIEIKDDLGDRTREWEGYPGYLSQILFNLLSNIERYAYPEGTGGKVEILIAADCERNEPSFVLTVRDYGCGIEPADLPKVFEAFFTTGRSKGGSGLGLAIVHNLVTDALKGRIDLQSGVGKGTTAVITFPQIISEEA